MTSRTLAVPLGTDFSRWKKSSWRLRLTEKHSDIERRVPSGPQWEPRAHALGRIHYLKVNSEIAAGDLGCVDEEVEIDDPEVTAVLTPVGVGCLEKASASDRLSVGLEYRLETSWDHQSVEPLQSDRH